MKRFGKWNETWKKSEMKLERSGKWNETWTVRKVKQIWNDLETELNNVSFSKSFQYLFSTVFTNNFLIFSGYSRIGRWLRSSRDLWFGSGMRSSFARWRFHANKWRGTFTSTMSVRYRNVAKNNRHSNDALALREAACTHCWILSHARSQQWTWGIRNGYSDGWSFNATAQQVESRNPQKLSILNKIFPLQTHR